MSHFVHQAEVELLRLVVLMHSSLNDVAHREVAEQQTTEAEAKQVGSLALQLEQSRNVERQRLEAVAGALRRQVDHLTGAIANLSDDTEEALDAEIRELNSHNVALGKRMVQLYDEAAALTNEIETEILSEPV